MRLTNDKYPDLAFLMSPLAFGDFDADASKIDKQTASYFWFKTEKQMVNVVGGSHVDNITEMAGGVMLEQREVEGNVPTHFMKSISDKNARVEWITNEIFPKWYELTSKQPMQVREGMNRIIETGRQAGGNY